MNQKNVQFVMTYFAQMRRIHYLVNIAFAIIVGINIYLLKLKTINYYSLNALTMNAQKNLMKTLF